MQPILTLFELPYEASGVGGVHLDGVPFRRARDGKPIEMTIRFRSLYQVVTSTLAIVGETNPKFMEGSLMPWILEGKFHFEEWA